MGIKNPATYGEWYWASQVEAQTAYEDSLEENLAPYFSSLMSDNPFLEDLPPGVQSFISAISKPKQAGFSGFALGVGVGMIDDMLKATTGPAMKMLSRSINKKALETWLTIDEANTLFSRGKIDEGLWEETTKSEGYHDVIARFKYLSQLPYPTIPEIMLYARYHGDPENTRSEVFEKFDVPVDDYELYEWLTLQRASTGLVTKLHRRGVIQDSDLGFMLRQIGWRDQDIAYQVEDGWTIPNAMLLTQGNLIAGASDETILEDISRTDIHPEYARQYLDGILTKPATQDLIRYELRRDPNLSNLSRELQRVGVHPDYTDVYKELAYEIPPLTDLITMAVREVFTPAVAARFGQYEDYPGELTQWAEKKGLTKEWAERYWAAHWSLPSPQQGFEMLHRGIIDRGELNMLLRALDIMPYWRDRLIEIAYRPLTRVDVRRMYREGVLTETEVNEAYLHQGYSDENAKRMTLFTVRQTLSSLAKFTSTDVLNAYTKRMIEGSEARKLLTDLGLRREAIDHVMSTADYKRDWEFTESKIRGIRNLYRKKEYDDNTARSELFKLGLPSDQVEVLMTQWWYDIKEDVAATWTTAQTISFIKKGFITADRGRRELQLNGYDKEHIDVYMQAIT